MEITRPVFMEINLKNFEHNISKIKVKNTSCHKFKVSADSFYTTERVCVDSYFFVEYSCRADGVNTDFA